ncbi:hypothetical protein B0J14DRAFT_199865 [Halenospora varia]|nr:hypothetical protein B0J14DRAFT_199865 [Halenospora varia]
MNGMGLLEDTIVNFFPEPWNHPGFFESSSLVEMRQGSGASDQHRGSSEWRLGKGIFTSLKVGGVPFDVTSFKELGSPVVLSVGPPAIVPGDAHGMHTQRQRLASSLASIETDTTSRFLSGTLSCLFERRAGMVLSDTASRDRCLKLFDEAFSVMKHMIPEAIRKRCLEWLMFYSLESPNHISKMAKLMRGGRTLDIGATTQWMIS